MNLNRRSFCQSIGVAGVTVAIPLTSDSYCRQFMKSPFGKTGLQVSPVGLSASHLHLAESKSEADVMIRYLLDCGVNYFESSPNYGTGLGDEILGNVLHPQRDSVVITCKTRCVDQNSALNDLEESLDRLQTDHIDVWMLDNPSLTNINSVNESGGFISAAKKATQAGKCRFVGISGQSHPQWLQSLCEMYDFDVVQMPLNAVDPHYLSFEQTVLSQQNHEEIAVVGSHTFAWDALRDSRNIQHHDALRYAMSLPVSVTLVNCTSKQLAVADMRAAFDFKPLTEDETSQILANTKPLSNRDVEWYKAIV